MKRIAGLFILSAVFLSACTSTNPVRTAVVKEYEFTVTLEQPQGQAQSARQTFKHPYATDIANLEKLLADLTYRERDGLLNDNQPSPVFQQVEIDRLAPVLTAALAKADASQRLRFLSFNQGQSLLFTVSRKTEGVIFIGPDGRFNIAFNYINAKRLQTETSAMHASYATIDPLTIQTADTTIAPPAPHAELHRFASGRQAPLWVVTELEKLEKNGTPPLGKATAEAPRQGVPKAEPTVPAVEKSPAAQATDDKLREDIKINLKYLKELMDEGLISEKDYQTKKMELLGKLD